MKKNFKCLVLSYFFTSMLLTTFSIFGSETEKVDISDSNPSLKRQNELKNILPELEKIISISSVDTVNPVLEKLIEFLDIKQEKHNIILEKVNILHNKIKDLKGEEHIVDNKMIKEIFDSLNLLVGPNNQIFDNKDNKNDWEGKEPK